jgi:hypothetical protein
MCITRLIAIIGLTLAGLSPAVAAQLVCSGQIAQLTYHSPDRFMIRLSSMNNEVFFCNTSSTWTVSGTTYTTSAETCRAMVALFMAAKLTGQAVTSMYFDGDQVPSTCSSWAAWSYANVRYFQWQE